MNTHFDSVAAVVDLTDRCGSAEAPSVVAEAAIGRAAATRSLTLALVAIAATVGVATAHAGCADPRTPRAVQPHVTLPALAAPSAFRDAPANEDIVGTWLVTYSVGGTATGQAYIQWHSDGTEWENINYPIEGGNICMGSWKRVDARHVSRNHYGWLYTSGILSGYFNETETAEVARNGTYNGITKMMIYDIDGHLQTEFGGTSSAVLIEP